MEAMECDILVIGGGPAGSTAAAMLAERGRDVVLVEKSRHPRFHIGESLLPLNMPVLERLGVVDAVKAVGMFKPGAEFVDDSTGHRSAFRFADSLNKAATIAYQVPRAPFDEILFKNAGAKGASTYEGVEVTDVLLPEPGVRAWVKAEHDGVACAYAPRYVLDCTGRDTLLAGKLGLKKSNKRNSTAAVFAHWRGVRMQMDVADDPGFITVHLVEDGWFWMIPLPGEMMSIGFVGNADVFKNRGMTAAELYLHRLRNSPTIAARMIGAEQVSEIHSAGNYSYRATRASGDGYMMVGDAFAFLDPVFSSGVLLAMTAAELAADVVDTWFDNPARAHIKAREMERTLCQAMDSLSWLVTRINTPVLREMFMSPSNVLRMRDGLVAMLAGNLRIDRRLRLPVLAFKSVYYGLTALRRFGIRAEPEPRMLPAE